MVSRVEQNINPFDDFPEKTEVGSTIVYNALEVDAWLNKWRPEILFWMEKAEKWDNRRSKNYWIDKYNRVVEEWNQLSGESTVLEKKCEELEKRLEAVKKLLDEAEIKLRIPKFGEPFIIPVFIRRLHAAVEGVAEEEMEK